MSETEQAFSIDKPGAYKTRDGQVVDIVEVTVTGRSAFGWFRTDTAPCPLRRWDTSGRGYIPIPHDIIEAIPFVVDGPGRYMMRDGRVAIVDQMDRQNSVSGQRIGGWYKSTADSQKTDTSWHVDGAWYAIKGIDPDRDLVRKMHPLEQEPVTKAPKEQKAPELKNTSEAPTFRIDTPGVYRTRDGRLVDIEGVGNNAVGTFVADPLYHHFWNLDGRTTSGLDASSDIIQKIKSKHLDQPKPITSKKPTVAIKQPGKYRMRNGLIAIITHASNSGALGFIDEDVENDINSWLPNGRCSKHCESGEDIVEKIEQHVETKTLDPVAKWSEEAMRHIEEYVAIIKKKGGPMDPLIEEALRVFRPDLCPPKAGQEKTGAEVMDALGKAAKQTADEPKKPSAGFDVVIIKSNDGAWTQIVAGGYSEHNGVVTVNPADAHESYMTSKRPGALILKRGDFVRCPAHNVTCVIHYGGEE